MSASKLIAILVTSGLVITFSLLIGKNDTSSGSSRSSQHNTQSRSLHVPVSQPRIQFNPPAMNRNYPIVRPANRFRNFNNFTQPNNLNSSVSIPFKKPAPDHVQIDGLNESSIDLAHLNVFKPGVKKITISNTSLNEVPKGLGLFPNLIEFNFDSNEKATNCKNILEARNLFVISISNNKQIKELPIGLSKFQHLVVLNLKGCSLEKFPSDINRLKDIMVLGLAGNPFKIVPEWIRNLSELQVLGLGGSDIEVVPDFISNLKSLKKLGIPGCQIKKLPSNIGNLKNLTELYLSNCQIERLPDSICNLSNLIEIDLSYNKLEELPEEIFKLSSLEKLNLSSNNLKTLPKRIGECKKLKTLDLDNNFIEKIDMKLPKLEQLHLSGNPLGHIPEQVISIDTLLELSLKNVNLKDVPHNIVDLNELEVLDLRDNELSTFPEVVTGLSNLDVLDLGGNCITFLPVTLPNDSDIRILSVANNRIISIPYEYEEFAKSFGFEMFDVSGNYISNRSDDGMGTDALKLKFKNKVTIGLQSERFITIDEVEQENKQQPLHWNLSVLATVNQPIDPGEDAGEITDKQMVSIWTNILKYFVFDSKDLVDSYVEQNYKHGDDRVGPLVAQILDSKVFKDLKREDLKTKEKCHIDPGFTPRGIVTNNLLEYSKDTQENKTQKVIQTKKYIKAVFFKYLALLAAAKDRPDDFHSVGASITNLASESLSVCTTGQLEGLVYSYNLLFVSKEGTKPTMYEDSIKKIIYPMKESSFVQAATEDSKQNVHSINRWRLFFKNKLGINTEVDDQYRFFTINKNNAGIVLKRFLKNFSIDLVIERITNEINKNHFLLDQAKEFLRNQARKSMSKLLPLDLSKLPESHREVFEGYLSYDAEIPKLDCILAYLYFSYTIDEELSVIETESIKREGVIEILIGMDLLEKL